MKTGWTQKTLGEVAEFKNGLNYNKNSNGQTLPVVGVGDFQSNYIVPIGNLQSATIDGTLADEYAIRRNDILTVRSNGSKELVGRCMLVPDVDETTSYSGFIIRIRFDADQIAPRFLLHFMKSSSTRERLTREGGGANISNINQRKLSSLPVPVPPLPEQRRIVGILDEAFDGIATAIANTEKNLQNAKDLFESILFKTVVGANTSEWRLKRGAGDADAKSDLTELLGRIEGTARKASRREETVGHETVRKAIPREWRVTPIDALFNLIDYRGKTPVKSQTGRRLITAKNIKMGYLSDEPVTFISEDAYRKWMVRGFPKPGDIFFVTEGHTMGFVALNTRTDDFALAQRTITLQPAVPFDTKFFFYFMMSDHFQDLVKLNATGAAAVGMKGSKFRTLPLAFPPIAEQIAIVSILEKLSVESQRLESTYQRKLAALDELKKSLLHQAFSGQL